MAYHLFAERHNVAAAGKDGKPARKLGFVEEFLIGGVAAGISKTVAAPIERVKLMVQNQVSPGLRGVGGERLFDL